VEREPRAKSDPPFKIERVGHPRWFLGCATRPESIRIERAVFDSSGLDYVGVDEYWEKCGVVSEDFTYKVE
jgi:hypothetical protein